MAPWNILLVSLLTKNTLIIVLISKSLYFLKKNIKIIFKYFWDADGSLEFPAGITAD